MGSRPKEYYVADRQVEGSGDLRPRFSEKGTPGKIPQKGLRAKFQGETPWQKSRWDSCRLEAALKPADRTRNEALQAAVVAGDVRVHRLGPAPSESRCELAAAIWKGLAR